MELDNIKSIWQEQKAKDVIVKSSNYYSSLMDDIKKNEEKTKRTYTIGGFLLIATIFFLDKMLFEHNPNKSVYTYIGMGLIIASIVMIIFLSWSTIIKFKVNQISSSSIDFLKNAREKYRLRNKVRTTAMPLYIILLTVGIGITYIDITSQMTMTLRIVSYLFLLCFISFVSFLGFRNEKKRYIKEVKPIEEKIDTLLEGE